MPLSHLPSLTGRTPRRRRWAYRLAPLAVIALAGFAAIQGAALSFPGVQLVRITIQTQMTDHVNIFTTKLEARPDDDDVVFFDLLGTTDLPSADHLDMTIYPTASPVSFNQALCCEVVKNTFYGKAQLGSVEYPVEQDQTYSFELKLTRSGNTVARGIIDAQVTELVEQSRHWQKITSAVGLLAALLQVSFLFAPSDTLLLVPKEAPDAQTRPAPPTDSPGGGSSG